jgi:hypothetical protein
MHYWINTVSLAHVQIGVAGGFTQADHGRDTRLKRLEKGDMVVFYSPRTEFRSGDPLQAFTAIGRVVDDEPYREATRPDARPWRRRVEFFESRQAAIRPLIGELDFIRDKKRWGYPFRRGLFEIERPDFERIAAAMNVRLEAWP